VIQWGSFVLVAIASLVVGCAVVLLFSLGLRFAGPATEGRMRGLGILCFVISGLVVTLGVCLVIPFFSPFFASV
jgi:hypothetical protein